MPVLGFLHSQAPDLYANVLAGFRRGLKDNCSIRTFVQRYSTTMFRPSS
jgi:hypothetical protein